MNCPAASYSHGTSVQLPSALESLTAVFGMGTGGASPPLPPDNIVHYPKVITFRDVRRLSNECLSVPFYASQMQERHRYTFKTG